MALDSFHILLPICISIQALYWMGFLLFSNKISTTQKTIVAYSIFWSILIAYTSYMFSGSSQLHSSIIPPGSPLTRLPLPMSDHFLRRLIEPSLILWFLCQMFMLKVTETAWTKSIKLGLCFLILAHFFDASLLNIQAHLIKYPDYLPHIASAFWIIGLVLLLIGGLSSFRMMHYEKKQLRPLSLTISCALCLLLYVSGSRLVQFLNKPHPIIGAHYYVWFPENWKAGISNHSSEVEPPSYRSDDSAVINQHLESMKSNNINLVILDWWPQQPVLKNRAKKVSETLSTFPDMHFAAHFETFDIANNNSSEPLFINSKRIEEVCLYFEHLAKRLFTQPQYLRINDKPVVFWYVSRQMYGNIPMLMLKVRKHVLEKTGFEMYLVGDEVFPQVVRTENDRPMLNSPMHPNWNRLSYFDALYAYNPFDPTLTYPGNPKGNTQAFLKYTRALYRNYSYISAAAAKPFFPTLIPGYDDTKIRPSAKHAIIERELDGELLIDSIQKILDEELTYNNISLITSWNEWNEGTNVEKDEKSLRSIAQPLQQ